MSIQIFVHFYLGYMSFCYWASLVAQMVKSPPAMRDNWVRPLDWEDPLEKGRGTQSSILAWGIPQRGAWCTTVALKF